jgi:hypothetical protein
MNPSILSSYPKARLELPDAYRAIYKQHYLANRSGAYVTTSVSNKMEGWMHRRVASDLTSNSKVSTLEIGAGTLNQLPFEPPVGPYDIVEPFEVLYESAPGYERLRHVFSDIIQARDSGPYDRITSIAAFEHITDLPVVVAQAALLLKPEGSLRVAIPNEGTVLWRLGTLISGYEFKKRYGLEYELLMRYEHINSAAEVEDVLCFFFNRVSCRVFGLCKSLAFYRFYECRGARLDTAREHLTKRDISW